MNVYLKHQDSWFYICYCKVKYPVGHTAVLLIMQYARMTQCTTVLPGDVQLAL